MGAERSSPSVIVIGAGMTGIQVAIMLRKAGIEEVTLLEKAATIGGTWRENTYPGVSCDVPSHAYTYSFAPNPDWSNLFARGDEIYRYFDDVFHRFGLDDITRFGEAVTRCAYRNGRWQVVTSSGVQLEADFIFCATGMLHHPVLPDIPGLDQFDGPAFHSARWDHGVDLKGKRIGVIGNGSSGAQLVPELVAMADTEVTVFQRTPQWIIKTSDKVYSAADKARFRRQPWRMNLVRRAALMLFEQSTKALTGDGWLARQMLRLFAWNGRRYLEQRIADPELRAKLTPDYRFGCKRVIMNDSFYPAIQQPNAHLVTESIERIGPEGLITADGAMHRVDVLVMATGFNPAAYMRPMEFLGRDGLSIERVWERKVQAYRSMLVPGFPNCFLMLGPNSPIGNNSVITLSEVQTRYAMGLIERWQQGRLDTIEATSAAMTDWNVHMKQKMQHTVWASGCNSWYLDEDGDPLTWPDTWSAWVASMEDIRMQDFVGN